MIYKKDTLHDQVGIISRMQGWFNYQYKLDHKIELVEKQMKSQ